MSMLVAVGVFPLPAKDDNFCANEVSAESPLTPIPSARKWVFESPFGNSDCTVIMDSAGEFWCLSTKTHTVERLRGL
jgi:hypothetical protein